MIRSRKRMVITSSIIAAPLIAPALAFLILVRVHENARRSSCMNNLKQIAVGLAQYTKDFDDKLPPIASHSAAEVQSIMKINKKRGFMATQRVVPPFGWCDALIPYTKSIDILNCPSETSHSDSDFDSTKRGYTDYWLNGRVAGRKFGGPNSSSVILNGDGNGYEQSDARYSKTGLPAVLSDETQRWDYPQRAWPLRHLYGANYAFLDGHAKWLTPAAISTTPGATYSFTP